MKLFSRLSAQLKQDALHCVSGLVQPNFSLSSVLSVLAVHAQVFEIHPGWFLIANILHQLDWAVFSMKKVITGVTAKFHQGIMLIPNSYSHECHWMKTKKYQTYHFWDRLAVKTYWNRSALLWTSFLCSPSFLNCSWWVTMHFCLGAVLMWNQWLDPNQSWLFSRSWCSTAGFCRGSVIPTDVQSVCSDKWVFSAPLAPSYHSYFSVATQECVATLLSRSKMFLLSKVT